MQNGCPILFLAFPSGTQVSSPGMRFSRVFQILAGAVTIASFIFVCVVTFIVAKFNGDALLPADCAIVFGTAVRTASSQSQGFEGAGPGILRRVGEAALLYRSHQVRHLYLTGGRGEGAGESEAVVMKRVALAEGVASADITTENRSHSTWQNLLFTRPLTAGCTSVVGISDRYHLARIEVLASLMGWHLRTYPAHLTAGMLFETESVIREALGILLAPVNSFSR